MIRKKEVIIGTEEELEDYFKDIKYESIGYSEVNVGDKFWLVDVNKTKKHLKKRKVKFGMVSYIEIEEKKPKCISSKTKTQFILIEETRKNKWKDK
jgi:hypothetical protein